MDRIKQVLSFILLTAITVCFITLHSRNFAPLSAKTSVTHICKPEYGNKIVRVPCFNNGDSVTPALTPITVDSGIRLAAAFYEKHSGKEIPRTCSIENAYGTEDKYICFALDNRLIDFHTYKNLTSPMTKHTAVSIVWALVNHKDLGELDKSTINLIDRIPNLLSYSDIHKKALELCRMGIIGCEGNDGEIFANEKITYEYFTDMLTRLESPSFRQHFFVNEKAEGNEKPFEAVLQNPELPTGCEVTSLTAVLNHIGYSIDKVELAEDFLDKGEPWKTDFRRKFAGDPSSTGAYGCYAPVIVNCANKYLSYIGSSYRAYDLTGTQLSDLFYYLDRDIPVIIWATIDMNKSYPTDRWFVGTQQLVWIGEEHCMVLYGYDEQKDMLLVADPLVGNTQYERELFEERYKELFMQAVIIR